MRPQIRAGELAIGKDFDEKLVIGRFARKTERQRQQPAARRQNHVRPLQKTARPPRDIDRAIGWKGGPVVKRKKVGGPQDARGPGAVRMLDIRAESADGDFLLYPSKLVPPVLGITTRRGETAARDLIQTVS